MSAHVMIDLETMSTRKNAAILQIAAVEFDSDTGSIIVSEFSEFISDGADHGHVDTQTVAWWMQQDAAKRVGAGVGRVGVPLRSALGSLHTWITQRGPFAGIWSHGASFDLPVLESAFVAFDLTKPWEYRAERDTRTLYALAGGMPAIAPGEGFIRHDALSDARLQAEQVIQAMRLLQVQADRAAQWKLEAERARTIVSSGGVGGAGGLSINGRWF